MKCMYPFILSHNYSVEQTNIRWPLQNIINLPCTHCPIYIYIFNFLLHYCSPIMQKCEGYNKSIVKFVMHNSFFYCLCFYGGQIDECRNNCKYYCSVLKSSRDLYCPKKLCIPFLFIGLCNISFQLTKYCRNRKKDVMKFKKIRKFFFEKTKSYGGRNESFLPFSFSPSFSYNCLASFSSLLLSLFL